MLLNGYPTTRFQRGPEGTFLTFKTFYFTHCFKGAGGLYQDFREIYNSIVSDKE